MTAILTTSDGEGLDIETLPTMPGLGGLYAKGAASSGLLAAGRALPAIPGLGSGAPAAEPSALTLPRVVHRVSGVPTDGLRSHLRDYQRLMHEPGSELLPSGYLHVLAFPLTTSVMVRGDFPLPLLGMVHLANDASLLRPVRLGDPLEVRAWAERLRPHRRGVQVDMVAEVRVGDEPVWRGVSTYLSRAFHLPEDAQPSVARPPTDAHPSDAHPSGAHRSGAHRSVILREVAGPSDAAAPDDAAGATTDASMGPATSRRMTGGELRRMTEADSRRMTEADSRETAGDEPWAPPLPTARWVLPGGTGRAYGAISGDRNPIHLSALSAKAFGFPRAIAHGMYTAARALAEVGPARGTTYRWTVEFGRPVLLPGTVDVAITSTEAGFEYLGWNAARRLRHFRGTVTPL